MTSPSDIRSMVGRRTAAGMGIIAFLVAGCAQVGGPSLTFWDVIFSMVAFFFWFMLIWIFIALFADLFRRHDLSGIAKAGWLILIVILPFIGALIYIAMRPSDTISGEPGSSMAKAALTPQDLQMREAERQAADERMRPPGA